MKKKATKENMKGKVSDELQMQISPKEAWKVFGSLQLAKIGEKALPNVVESIDVIEGDGSVGTIVKLNLTPAIPMSSYTEKFTIVDDEKMVKETEVIEGGYLDLGFTLYRCRLEIVTNPSSTSFCAIKVTIEYELKEEFVANASLVSAEALMTICKAAIDYLLKN